MTFTGEYLDMQLRFGAAVARVKELPLETALLEYTTLFLTFGLSRSFDPQDPVWQLFIRGLEEAVDPLNWTEQCFLSHSQPFVPPDPFGCFRYDYREEAATVRIHFKARDASGRSALSREHIPARIGELRTMFASIRQQHPQAKLVRGNSWLYNLEAYRRLYPPAFSTTLAPAGYEFQFLALWGQFLHRTGELRQPAAETFLVCIDQQTSMTGLEQCFPYQVLATECNIQEFYAWYGV